WEVKRIPNSIRRSSLWRQPSKLNHSRHARPWAGHPRLACCWKDVDARDKPGHDGTEVDDDATNPGLTRACALPKIGAADMTERGVQRMRSRIAIAIGLAVFVTFALAARPHRAVAQSPFGDPNAEPAPFNPQMAALMSMLIQPRHAKLGLAGKADNWPLAGYALKELKQGFVVVSR